MVKFVVGDIGGTNSRLELWEIKGGDHSDTPEEVCVGKQTYPSKKFSHLTVILKLFIEEFGGSEAPRACCLAVAGPVRANTSQITNLNWLLDGEEMAKQLKIPTANFILVNDFVGTGYGLLALESSDVVVLHSRVPTPMAVKACVGAGTGLGETYLTWNGTEYDTWASEGGHSEFCPRNDEEWKLSEFIKNKFRIDRVSIERVVSGSAIPMIYDFFKTQYPAEVCAAVEGRLRVEDPGAVIAECAQNGSCNLCFRAIMLFVSAYGSECGNMALKTLSYGGLYVAGGIAMKILWAIERDHTFWNAFVNKGRMKPLLDCIPVFVVKPENVGLMGAKVVCRRSLRRCGFSVKGELDTYHVTTPSKENTPQRFHRQRNSLDNTQITAADIRGRSVSVQDVRTAAVLGGIAACVATLTASATIFLSVYILRSKARK